MAPWRQIPCRIADHAARHARREAVGEAAQRNPVDAKGKAVACRPALDQDGGGAVAERPAQELHISRQAAVFGDRRSVEVESWTKIAAGKFGADGECCLM